MTRSWRMMLMTIAAIAGYLTLSACATAAPGGPASVRTGGLAASAKQAALGPLPPIPSDLGITVRRVDHLSADFIRGADVSMLAQIEKSGGRFYRDDGAVGQPLAILRDHGVNWVRLRLWNHPFFAKETTISGVQNPAGAPVGGGNDEEQVVLALAKQAKAEGMKVLLDFHYSDFWADPGNQQTPSAWAGLSAPALERAVYDFTLKVLRDMSAEGAAPDMVQIGNEINNGMLWPVGRVGSGPGAYDELIRLLSAGVNAVREADPGAKVMIHIADNGTKAVEDFFDQVAPKVDFDVIGLSYYPYWHGSIAELRATLDAVAARYGMPIVIAETAYPFTDKNADSTPNSFSGEDPLAGGFAVSVQGQATEIRDVMAALAAVPDGRGIGLFYWEPDWIPVKGAGWMTGAGDGWENQAWWDFSGKPLASMWTYRLVSESDVSAAPTVASVPEITVRTAVHQIPELPDRIPAYFSDGSIPRVSVTWQPVDPSEYAQVGSFTVVGSVAGSSLPARAKVTVTQNAVVNGGFESGSLAPWQTEASSGGQPVSAFTVEKSPSSNNSHSGDYTGSYWYGAPYTFKVFQAIRGLAPGRYTLRAWVMGASGKPGSLPAALRLFAESGGAVRTAEVTNTGWRKWVEYTIGEILVGPSGSCTVGLEGDMNAGDWGKLDDVELVPAR